MFCKRKSKSPLEWTECFWQAKLRNIVGKHLAHVRWNWNSIQFIQQNSNFVIVFRINLRFVWSKRRRIDWWEEEEISRNLRRRVLKSLTRTSVWRRGKMRHSCWWESGWCAHYYGWCLLIWLLVYKPVQYIYKPDAGVDTRWMWTDGRLANGSRVPKCQSSPLPSHFCFVFLFKFELIKLLLLLLCGPGTQINLPLITAITINSQWAWQPANTVSQSINLPKQQQNGLGSRARKQSALFLLRCQSQMPIDHGAKAY